jgi:hypothetical protein
MQLYKNLLRIWIAIASVIAFVLGWIGLAHSPKPIQNSSASTTTTTTTTTTAQLAPLPPMPSISQVQQDSFVPAPFVSSPQISNAAPVFRGRGS